MVISTSNNGNTYNNGNKTNKETQVLVGSGKPNAKITPLTNHDWGSIYTPNYKLKFWMVLLKIMGYDPSITLW